MKKRFNMIIACLLVCTMFSGCGSGRSNGESGSEKQTKGPNGETTTTKEVTVPADPYKNAVSFPQNFSTKCKKEYVVYWDDTDGLYIETENEKGIPYVLIYRFDNIGMAAADYVEYMIIPEMEDTYGSNLISVKKYGEYEIAGQKLCGALFTYKVNAYTVESLRLFATYGNTIVNFTAKYIQGEKENTMAALEDAVKYFELDSTGNQTASKDIVEIDGLKIKVAESKKVNYVKYTDPSGYFTAEIPEGWEVKVGLPSGEIDLISYAVKIYDPKNPDRMVCLNLNTAGMTKSETARNWFLKNYPGSPQGKLPVVSEITTAGFFGGLGESYGYRDFTVINNIGKTVLGGDLLVANCISESTGKKLEGVFHSYVTSTTYPVLSNPIDLFSGMIDAGVVTAYSIVMKTAPAEEFSDWHTVLEHCLESIVFTEEFHKQRSQLWKQVMGNAQYLAQTAGEMGDALMDSWENRNKTNEILSQKQSDATLGYERIYDTETGAIYKAYNGFSDDYKGTRYQPASDSQYTMAIYGYIEK